MVPISLKASLYLRLELDQGSTCTCIVATCTVYSYNSLISCVCTCCVTETIEIDFVVRGNVKNSTFQKLSSISATHNFQFPIVYISFNIILFFFMSVSMCDVVYISPLQLMMSLAQPLRI